MKPKKTNYWRILLCVLAVTVLLNLAGCLPALCDLYTDHVYRYIADGLGHLTALLPFALGEIIMYLGVLLAVLAVIFALLLIFLHRRAGFRRFAAHYYKSLLMALSVTVLVYTVNWAIPVRGTVLGQGKRESRSYTYDEVKAVDIYLYTELNAAAELVPTDSAGDVIFPSAAEVQAGIAAAMQACAAEFPRLAGFYPPVKTALCSDILDRMGIGGYTYPYTMELTHGKYSAANPIYCPVLDAHESAHHQGYYKENEAEFLSEVCLAQSDDPFLRYCGLHDMSYYIDFALYEAVSAQIEAELAEQGLDPAQMTDAERTQCAARFDALMSGVPAPSDKATQIWEQAMGIRHAVYETDPHPIDNLPAVNTVIEQTAEVGWNTQAQLLQENTYDGATLLLLQYYEGTLF